MVCRWNTTTLVSCLGPTPAARTPLSTTKKHASYKGTSCAAMTDCKYTALRTHTHSKAQVVALCTPAAPSTARGCCAARQPSQPQTAPQRLWHRPSSAAAAVKPLSQRSPGLGGTGTTAKGAAAPLLRWGVLRGPRSAGRTGNPGSPHLLQAPGASGWCALAAATHTCTGWDSAGRDRSSNPAGQHQGCNTTLSLVS